MSVGTIRGRTVSGNSALPGILSASLKSSNIFYGTVKFSALRINTYKYYILPHIFFLIYAYYKNLLISKYSSTSFSNLKTRINKNFWINRVYRQYSQFSFFHLIYDVTTKNNVNNYFKLNIHILKRLIMTKDFYFKRKLKYTCLRII